MTVPTFEQSVEIAKYVIAPHLAGCGDVDRNTWEGNSRWRAFQNDTKTEEGYLEYQAENLAWSYLHRDQEEVLELAKSHHLEATALRRFMANVFELGGQLAPQFQSWLISYLRDEVALPKRPRGRPDKFVRHKKVFDAVQTLVNRGLNPTRNDTSEIHESACDAVAFAHRELGMPTTSYSAISERYAVEKREWSSPDVFIKLDSRVAEKINNILGTTD